MGIFFGQPGCPIALHSNRLSSLWNIDKAIHREMLAMNEISFQESCMNSGMSSFCRLNQDYPLMLEDHTRYSYIHVLMVLN